MKWRRQIGLPLLLGLVLIGGGCEFSLFEPPDLPKWGIALTMPLINKSYTMAEVVNDSTIFADSLSQELQVQFAGMLDTSRIDADFLEIQLPAGAVPDPINETVDAPDASAIFSAVAESVVVSFALDDLLNATGVPGLDTLTFPQVFPFAIDSTLWNSIVAVPPVSPISVTQGPVAVVDTASLLADNPIIQTIRYIQLSSTGGANKFVTRVFNDDWPTDIESIALQLASGALAVSHDTTVLSGGDTYADSTDLASAQLGTDLTMSLSMSLPATADTAVIVAANTDPQIDITIRLEVGGVDSVAIRTNRTSLLPAAPEPVALPAEVEIISGVLRAGESDPINTIKLTGLRSTLPFDIEFELTFPNFSSGPSGSDSLRFGPYTLSDGQATQNDTVNLSGYSFLNPAGSTAIDSFEFGLVAEVLEQDVVFPLDGSTLGAFQATFSLGDLYFSSITGNFEIAFDAVNTTIEDIPTGFAGFQFDRLSLTLFFHNQIDLPVALDLELKGRSLEGDSATVPINAPLNYPSNPSGSVDNGTTANTVIVLDQTSVRTYWLPNGSTDIAQAWDSTVVGNGAESIVDVLNLPPESITVGGAAEILGEGTVAADSALWGEFELVAPFAFIMPIDITFLPANPLELPAMDPATRETVQNALLGASLTVSTLMDIPIGGSIAMLVSDTTLFSLALDKLDDIAAGIPTAARTGDTTIYNNLTDVLAADSIMGISHIVFIPEETEAGGIADPTETRAKRVEFYTNPSDTEPAFFIGRLFQLTLPGPRSVNSAGHVTEPGDTTETLMLDAERVGWIASDTTLFMNPLITFNGSSSVRTFQSTDSIRIAAFITFNVSSEFLSPPAEVDPSEITITAAGNFAVETGDTVWVDLDTVFTHPNVDAADMEVAVASSHTGIVSVALRNVSSPTKQKLVRAIATGPGTAKITITADDDGDDDIPAVETSFLVIVSAPAAMPRPPDLNLGGRLKGDGR